ncbi:NADH-quinone oxidoreductase subunit NuoK [Candidatus Bathyarchaeota archaeon]|nr:NADH-quinone oxidoreductase subunit NuoK [Candidatus Bathyarchaeota archaeon]
MHPFTSFIVAVFLLLLIGLLCLTTRRNMIRLLIGVEILFNAANLNFIALSIQRAGFIDPLGQMIVLMAIVLDGCVVAVGLVMTLNAYRHYGTLDVRKLRRLRW